MSDDTDSSPKGTSDSSAPHVKPVTGTTRPNVIAPHHLTDLQDSGLTIETIELAGLYSESKSKPIADLLGWRWTKGGGLVFPFVDYDSRSVVLSRVKPDNPRALGNKGKLAKYEQPKGLGAYPYIGPRCIREQRLERCSTVYWPEGEKKTLCMDQMGYAAIGLTGCHVWNDAEAHRNGDGMKWSKTLQKYAEKFVPNKHHVMVFDADSASNDNVMLALQRLAGLLLNDGALSVRFVRIPEVDGVKGFGIDDYYQAHGEAKTKELIGSAELVAIGEDVQPIPPKDPLLRLSKLAWLKGAKLHKDLRLPPRFVVRRDKSLWLDPPLNKPDDPPKEMMRTVVVPTSLMQSVEDDEQRLEIAYFARGHWNSSVVDRRALRDSRRALSELPPAVAIDSNNSALVVTWLSEYMRHNEHRLPLKRYVSKCGWQKVDGARCFLVDRPIVSSKTRVNIVADESGDRADMLDALRPIGNLAAHRASLKVAFDTDPICALTILASLAAPLLTPLGAPNFGVHLYGDSSTGKTSMMVCAASVFGNPRNEQWVGSWNATGTAMELRAQTLCDLPLFFDEVGAGDKLSIERWVYMLINGSGKSRAQRSLSLRKTPSWQTVLIGTGERLLASERANTGAQVRLLQHRVSHFGELDAGGVDRVRESCSAHSGHVGREWLTALVGIEDWSPYERVYREAKESFRATEDGSLMQRQAAYYALLALAEHMASNVLGFGKVGGGTVRELFNNKDTRLEVVSAGARAIEVVGDWMVSEPDSFPGIVFGTSGGLTVKSRQTRKVNGVRHKGMVYFVPGMLREYLTSQGLSYAEVLSSWHDSGFLECDKGRKMKRVRWDGKRSWVVSVRFEALGIDLSADDTQLPLDDGDSAGGDFA